MKDDFDSCFSFHKSWARSETQRPKEVTWAVRTAVIYGKERTLPRLTAWYGTKAYRYSGVVNTPSPMPDWLELLRENVQHVTGAVFNSALLNLYRDGNDSVAWHSDDEPELGKEPTIASVSFGATRRFSIVHKGHGGKWNIDLEDGDLLVMKGRSQLDYLHCLRKTKKAVEPRINITFRYVR